MNELPLNKIIHGDCLEEMKKILDGSVDLVITSPPYNKHSANRKCRPNDTWRKANIKYNSFNDDMPEHEYQNWQKKILRELIRILKPNGSIFYNHKVRIVKHRAIIPTEWLSEFNIRQVLIWDRTNTPQLAPIRWFPITEYIYWITKGQVQPKFYKRSKHQHEIIRIPPKPMKEHPAPFPEELVETLMLNTTDEGDTVLDPFMGSGTTGKMAKQLGRNFIGIELDKDYYEIAKKRIEETPL